MLRGDEHETNPLRAPDGAGGSIGPALPVWDLSDLFPGPDSPALRDRLDWATRAAETFSASYEGRVGELTAAELATALAEYERIQQVLGRVMAFAQLRFAADSEDPVIGQFYQSMSERVTTISALLVFFTLALNRIEGGAMARLLADPALAHYAPWLRDLLVFRDHDLPDQLEQLLHEREVTGASAWHRLFDETMAGLRIPIGDAQLSLSETLNRLSDPVRERRAEAASAIGTSLAANRKLFALITNTLAKDKEIMDRWRHYPRPESSRNRANMVEDAVVDALVGAVVESFPSLSHRYYALKAKWLGLDTLMHWDRNAPLPGESDADIPWDQAKACVLGAYRRFSPELADIGQKFFDRPWIDAALRPGKSGGAFAHPTVPDAHPYLLLNYHGRTRDVMTLAHELGHGVHQILAAEQGYLLSGTPLTLAETASVFGEMLTFKSLLSQTTDPAQRRLLLASKIEDMLNTVVRQIAFFRFEQRVHADRREAELLPERIGEIWLEVQRESLGPAFTFTPEYSLFWAYVPHFIHTPFYVYAYAFGDCLVNALYAEYEAGHPDFAAKYLDLLRAGGRLRHRELLAPFGLDTADPGFWRRGLGVIAGLIDTLEQTL